MILVDTSVWIASFRATGIDIEKFVDLDDVVTCLPVVQEVLQGFDDERAWRLARHSLLSYDIVESPLGLDVVDLAVQLRRSARRAGWTVRSPMDCWIAACAIRNDLEVLHIDRDFAALAKVSGLRQRSLFG